MSELCSIGSRLNEVERIGRSSGPERRRLIAKVTATGGSIRVAYDRDLREFSARRSQESVQGPELPTLRDMQGIPGEAVAEFIAGRVGTIISWDD
jgi:hypothetical protein